MLGDSDAHTSQLVGPVGHVERSGIAVGGGGPGERRVPEVEPQTEEDAHQSAAEKSIRRRVSFEVLIRHSPPDFSYVS